MDSFAEVQSGHQGKLMAVTDVATWIDEFSRPNTVWFAKRLTGNDTLANKIHLAGPYIPKDFLFRVFPQLNHPMDENPDHRFDLYVDSHADHRNVRVVWYNNRVRINPVTKQPYGTRNETRITGFGGQQSALLDTESTGAIAVFVFVLDKTGARSECHVWVCDNELEEDIVEARIGPVEPKHFSVWAPGTGGGLYSGTETSQSPCRLTPAQIPTEWLAKFPTGEEIIRKTRELRPDSTLPVDQLLMRRRDCEFEIFRSVEEAFYLPRVQNGFSGIDAFIELAQSILQSRKSRAGNSLELHARDIFVEETLVAGTHFSHRPVIEGNKRPDFLFPTVAQYNDPAYPADKLRMLAAKTTCKDRWRQVINEADRIMDKHLLTLQEGVSENQFREMREARVQLVVPAGLHDSYPESVRAHLLSLESFVAEVRTLTL